MKMIVYYTHNENGSTRVCMTPEDAICCQRVLSILARGKDIYKTDKLALQEFMIDNWANEEEVEE